ncbi:MAG: 2-hydroxychromene-2-carboxylate isomerase [Minicystis sp.]
MTPTIEFWFDFASTYSYLAACRIEALAAQHGISTRWRPFMLGPIFAARGWTTSPFNLYADKGRYMWRDVERLATEAGLPFSRPSVFPRNSVLAARVALVGADEGWIVPFSEAVFRAGFSEDRDIAAPEVIDAILAGLGQDGPAIRARAESPAHKPRLRAQTEEAASLGIFGAPTFMAGGELFWGNDRLEQAIAWARRRDATDTP